MLKKLLKTIRKLLRKNEPIEILFPVGGDLSEADRAWLFGEEVEDNRSAELCLGKPREIN